MTKNNDQKSLWKATLLEYLHNCFIGISNLTCSQDNCPLVLLWGEIERKLSKKGKCAFLKITKDKFLVVELVKYEENDLGTYENIGISFKSGKTQRTRPKDYVEPTEKDKKEIFLKPEEIILFFNNSAHAPNLQDAETIYLDDLWETKAKIKWDQEKSKKKVFLFCENDPSEETQSKKIDASEKDYLFYISDPSITNSIKNYEVYSPSQGKEERKQLWTDYREELSELKEFYGIRHNTNEKEDRQNNPEIDMIKSPFLALERDKQRERKKAIKEFEQKKFCQGTHTLSYGSYHEHQQEIELAEIVKSEQLEQKDNKVEEKPAEITQKEQKENFVLINKEK